MAGFERAGLVRPSPTGDSGQVHWVRSAVQFGCAASRGPGWHAGGGRQAAVDPQHHSFIYAFVRLKYAY